MTVCHQRLVVVSVPVATAALGASSGDMPWQGLLVVHRRPRCHSGSIMGVRSATQAARNLGSQKKIFTHRVSYRQSGQTESRSTSSLDGTHRRQGTHTPPMLQGALL